MIQYGSKMLTPLTEALYYFRSDNIWSPPYFLNTIAPLAQPRQSQLQQEPQETPIETEKSRAEINSSNGRRHCRIDQRKQLQKQG